MLIDFRSDTVTKPTPGMKQAMMDAQVGDDVFGEDPSINTLEQKSADMFGFEGGLFCPSGTMTNQIAIKCHTQPGDEVICDESAHVYQYEGGGIAFNAGASVKLINGDRGRITDEQVLNNINPDDVHKPRTSLVSLENTSNRGGGSCYDITVLHKIAAVCREKNLKLHLDGARIFNAIVAKNEHARDYGKIFDSVSICLSKSLGCPVGSVLLGTKEMIRRARRVRKVFGGGMRQAGFLAAAGIYALDHHIERLGEDHRHAKAIAEVLQKKSFVKFLLPVETNIIIFELQDTLPAPKMVELLKAENVLAYAISPNRVRLVLHLDITPPMVEKVTGIFSGFTA
jgi:threonine aldolase